MTPIVATGIAVVALAAVTFVLVAVLRLEHPWLQPWAIFRAALQLGILSLILDGVISSPGWVALFLLVMVGAATWVVIRRLRLTAKQAVVIAATIVVSAAVPVATIFATGAVEFSPRYVLAVGGILIGNTMTVSTLMGRSLGSLLVSNRDEIEGWLAIGATPRRASLRVVRSAASTSLIPSTDQTRTTGIVTLPGAFVGAVFGGASPIEAAQFQVLVLAGILAAGALTVTSVSWYFGAPTRLALPAGSDR
jgi:putative ABC transport system permease protein